MSQAAEKPYLKLSPEQKVRLLAELLQDAQLESQRWEGGDTIV